MSELELTAEEALGIIRTHGGYGTVRVYGVIADHPDFAGQVTAIKSQYHLDQYKYSRLYAVTNDGTGMPPIRRA